MSRQIKIERAPFPTMAFRKAAWEGERYVAVARTDQRFRRKVSRVAPKARRVKEPGSGTGPKARPTMLWVAVWGPMRPVPPVLRSIR